MDANDKKLIEYINLRKAGMTRETWDGWKIVGVEFLCPTDSLSAELIANNKNPNIIFKNEEYFCSLYINDPVIAKIIMRGYYLEEINRNKIEISKIQKRNADLRKSKARL